MPEIDDNQWSAHIGVIDPEATPFDELKEKLGKYFKHNKAESSIADFLDICSIDEMPQYILDTIQAIHDTIVIASITDTVSDEDGGCLAEKWLQFYRAFAEQF